LAAFVAISSRVALACPLCAENMSKDVYGKNPSQLGRGFFWSIILMIAAPFLTVAFVSVKLVLARRRARESSARVQPGGGIPSTPLSS
jgi:hypothetical protein